MPVYYKKAYFKALKQNMNEAQYEAYRKQGDVKWIEDGIYINRTVTDGFKNVVNLEGKAFEKLIENQVAKIAIQQAREHYNVLNPSTLIGGEIAFVVADGLNNLSKGMDFAESFDRAFIFKDFGSEQALTIVKKT